MEFRRCSGRLQDRRASAARSLQWGMYIVLGLIIGNFKSQDVSKEKIGKLVLVVSGEWVKIVHTS